MDFEEGIDFSMIRKKVMVGMNIFVALFGTYFAWISLHYVAAHLYTTYCVPGTIMGFILAPFTATMPHCQGLRWIVYYGGSSINSMWIMLGMWLSKFVTPIEPQ